MYECIKVNKTSEILLWWPKIPVILHFRASRFQNVLGEHDTRPRAVCARMDMTQDLVSARRAAKRSPILITGKQRKPMSWFFMVIMASGIARGHVRTTTELRPTWRPYSKKETQPWFTVHFVDIGHPYNWHLSKQGIRWPVSRDHIAGSILQLIEVECFCEVDHWPSAAGSRTHVRLTCWQQGRIVLKPF